MWPQEQSFLPKVGTLSDWRAECSELWPGVFGTLQLYLTHTALRVLSQNDDSENH